MGEVVNGRGDQNKRGCEKYKKEETDLGLSSNTLLTSLNIDISSILRSCL